ncbi:hypothetical protein MLD38_031898 [Melastoma candidum]|uniref:Uncharacterized protein n=1 Tax=Melastoma candidum TaxID=119954 RepID=A0ACB9MR49_9MYRT|nr:hypothetical protein MLD38_031898 [Melastoma candidum]
MTPDDEFPDEGYVATVAAAAYAVFSAEEAEEQNRRKMREHFESSRISTVDIKSGRQSSGGTSERRREAPGDAEFTKFPRRSSYAVGDVKGQSRRVAETEAKADAWEKAQMEKIRQRHEDMKSAILAWETQKKKEAKLLFDKQKINERIYQDKITKIEGIAHNASKQAEEKRRDKQSRVKEKAKRIRSRKGRLMCFCC